MAEQQGEESVEEPRMAESVRRADKRSRMAGLVVALGVFVLAQFVRSDPQFNAIVAAIAGIGIRIYIPYHASRAVTDPEAPTIAAHPDTGDYHYGAVGLALLVSPAVAFGAMAVTGRLTVAILAGAAGGVISYAELRSFLPRA